MKKPYVVAALAAAAALTMSACANNSGAAATTPGGVSLVTPGVLTVCTHLAYKPFQFTEGGKIVGFDVDLMDLVAKKLGVRQEVIDIEFGQITSGAAFTAKKCDAGAAAITITPERDKAAPFSTPYFASKQALLVKTDSPVTSLSDMKGKVLSVQTDTSGKVYAEGHEGEFGYSTKVFDDMPTASNAVLAGTVDGTLNDNGVLLDFARENTSTKVVQEIDTNEHYGFNVSKDNPALLSTINDVLKTAKSDGTFNTIYKKWFGVDAPAE
ncbi:transporter substrate-binding domain-containing protein [Propioniciclava flava]|uniref:ABC transporter substrate-binding protein n=1 Tax=Propioniciclava flava TaxID=2072026 RepID=A0A4Q2EKT4_9ACTN|nr:transporter substrate-binding domain-containing protein [Propioniciclava flava]RXW33386.1 ABC transporter substrate-binding protein [Propioniciclava flava]